MKKYILSLFVLVAMGPVMQANVETGVAAIPAGYYDGVSGKKGADNILNALNTCVSKNYNEISYKGLEPHYLKTDFYADTLWDMYSTCNFTYEEANIPQSKVCDGWNKEHVCCQSWLGSGPMVSDMFNVYPTDARVNNLRSNFPYGVVSGSSNGISGDPDKHALGKLGNSSLSGYTGKCYEPDDRYKGDFARTFFYMVARYRSNSITQDKNGQVMFTSGPTNLTVYSLSFLLDWHRNDPVSEKEIDRNQGVYGEQNNRNPFIDYPDLVEYIWGDKVGQTVDLSAMTPTCESVSGATKYGITWMVNGQVLQVDSVREHNKPTVLPEAPASCSESSETFYCWCGATWDGTFPDYLPADAITIFTAADVPAVEADVTYHAVFAHKDTQQTGIVESEQVVDFSKELSDKAKPSTLTVGAVTLTFDKGTNTGNAPVYYTNGNALRLYGGNTFTVAATNMTKIAFAFGSGDSTNEITASTGTFNGSIWTGSADEVTFTVSGSSGNRRLTSLTVTMNGEGSVTTYSDYLTSCNASGVEDTDEQPAACRKFLQDGRLYIEVNGQLFTITGQVIAH